MVVGLLEVTGTRYSRDLLVTERSLLEAAEWRAGRWVVGS
jgi:hypothetical protein